MCFDDKSATVSQRWENDSPPGKRTGKVGGEQTYQVRRGPFGLAHQVGREPVKFLAEHLPNLRDRAAQRAVSAHST